MLILPDSHDLIDLLEDEFPVSVQEFRERLNQNGARLVLSFTNVCELVGGLARGVEFMELRPKLQTVESLNPTYIREGFIFMQELESAWRSIQSGVEFGAPNPMVQRWDETFQRPGQSVAAMFVGYRLDEIVHDLHRHGSVPRDLGKWTRVIRQQIKNDRALPKQLRKSSLQHFRLVIERHCQQYGIRVATTELRQFSDWIHADPTRRPGLRLQFEVRRELVENPKDILKRGDILDFAHIGAVPYVDCAILDRRMCHYCGQACRRLRAANQNADYSPPDISKAVQSDCCKVVNWAPASARVECPAVARLPSAVTGATILPILRAWNPHA